MKPVILVVASGISAVVGFIGGSYFEKKKFRKSQTCVGSLILDTKEADPAQRLYLELAVDLETVVKLDSVMFRVIKK